MNKKIVGVVFVAAVVAAGVYLYADAGISEASRVVKTTGRGGGRPVPVVIATVEQKTVPVTIQTIGSVEAYATVSVKSRVDGQILKRFFTMGKAVHKGEPLFTVDPRPFAAKVDQLEANVARDKAQLASARADFKRYTQLSKTGYSSQQKLEQAKATAEGAEAAMKGDMAALEGARLDLEFTNIRSPIDGIAGDVLVDPGNLVKANDTNPLVIIKQIKPIFVTFSVPEQHLPDIKSRMAAGGLPVEVRVPGTSLAPEKGRVAFVNNVVDTATGTIQLKAQIDNQDGQLTPGQFVEVTMTVAELPQVAVVPSQTIQNGQDGSFVYIVRPDHTAQVRNVTVGPSYKDDVVVLKGLAPGERVVTEGQLRLRPGVRVMQPPPEAAENVGAAPVDAIEGKARKSRPAS